MNWTRGFVTCGLAGLLAVSALCSVSMAQPGQRGDRQPGQRGDRQPGQRRFGGMGGFRSMFGGGSVLFGLLQNEDVRKELELVDDQVKKIKGLQTEMQNQMQQMYSGRGNLSREERRQRGTGMREQMEKQNKELEIKIAAILLDHQNKRLRQIQVQMRTRRRGVAAALTSDKTAKELGLTDDQKKNLREINEQIQKKLREEISKLRRESEKELVGKVLTKDQQKKWKEMAGEPFEMRRRSWGERRQGRDRPQHRAPE